MKHFQTALFLVTVLGFSSAYAAELPDPSQYSVEAKDKFKGKPAAVDLASYKGAKTYRTKLREGAKKGPNFAGHLTVVQIGCGTQCQDNWVIDAKTGKILDRFSSMIYTKYQLDSTLMVVNPPNEQLAEAYKEHREAPFWDAIKTTYEVWKYGSMEGWKI